MSKFELKTERQTGRKPERVMRMAGQNDSLDDTNVTIKKINKLNKFNASWFMHINLWCKQSSE